MLVVVKQLEMGNDAEKEKPHEIATLRNLIRGYSRSGSDNYSFMAVDRPGNTVLIAERRRFDRIEGAGENGDTGQEILQMSNKLGNLPDHWEIIAAVVITPRNVHQTVHGFPFPNCYWTHPAVCADKEWHGVGIGNELTEYALQQYIPQLVRDYVEDNGFAACTLFHVRKDDLEGIALTPTSDNPVVQYNVVGTHRQDLSFIWGDLLLAELRKESKKGKGKRFGLIGAKIEQIKKKWSSQTSREANSPDSVTVRVWQMP